MKRFTFRLFLIRKLIESLTWSCIDEYTEYEDIANGLGRTLSALDGRRKALNADPELVEACRIISRGCGCTNEDVKCGTSDIVGRYPRCPGPSWGKNGHKGCTGWNCADSVNSARRWLAEHGIKE